VAAAIGAHEGTLLTPVGQLTIESVQPVAFDQISEDDARRAAGTPTRWFADSIGWTLGPAALHGPFGFSKR
jgi:hypothetical protein